jgi:hypothetical protein
VSRNLGRTDCYYCQGEVRPVEEWRPISPTDARGYFDEYQGMPVAAAACVDCEAKYLAWGWNPNRSAYPGDAGEICDLSFRSTFDDEPGREDLPKWAIRVVRERVGPWEGKP